MTRRHLTLIVAATVQLLSGATVALADFNPIETVDCDASERYPGERTLWIRWDNENRSPTDSSVTPRQTTATSAQPEAAIG